MIRRNKGDRRQVRQLKSKINWIDFNPEILPNFDGGDKIRMAFAQSTLIPATLPIQIIDAIAEIKNLINAKPLYLMLNIIPYNSQAGVHTDTLKTKNLQRWHLPIQTNPFAWYWSEKEGFKNMEAGYWHGPVPYWENHAAGNFGQGDRIHLVVDLENS